MLNVSNRQGRALEYIIVRKILEFNPGLITPTERAITDQRRDAEHYMALPHDLQLSYERCSAVLLPWLSTKFNIDDVGSTIDRLSDQDARGGDVTDIRIRTSKNIVNLSIKHNHLALKHQRPSGTAQHCGFERNGEVDILFKIAYKDIVENFILEAHNILPDATTFNELKSFDNNYVCQHLYRPICQLVSRQIREACVSPASVAHLFKFLVGSCDFYKIVNFTNHVHIYDFLRIEIPETVEVEQPSDSYLSLSFSNGWSLMLRLHTASSRIGDALKFDTQLANEHRLANLIPLTVIEKS